MAGEVLNCPYQGKPCDPGCVCFRETHSSLRGRQYPAYCTVFGAVEKSEKLKRQNNDEGDVI